MHAKERVSMRKRKSNGCKQAPNDGNFEFFETEIKTGKSSDKMDQNKGVFESIKHIKG